MTDFGQDFSAFPDLAFHVIRQLDNLIQALCRRLITPRGNLFYDPNYGTDVRGYLNYEYNQDGAAIKFEIEQKVIAEVEKDPRVLRATCELTVGTITQQSGRLTVTIYTQAGPFTLVLTLPPSSEVLNAQIVK